MQRLLLFVGLTFFLIGCSISGIGKEVHTYEGDYARVVNKIIPVNGFTYFDAMDKLSSLMTPSGYDNSWIRFAFGIADTAKGDLTLLANAKRETNKKFSADLSLTGNITGPTGTIEMKNIQGKLFANAQNARYYGFLQNLDISGTMLTDEMKISIEETKKFLGKWWVYDQMDAVGYMSNDEKANEFQSFMKVYMSFLKDLQTKEGFSRLNSLFAQNPLYEATSTGKLEGNEYIYPVIFSPKRTEKFVEKFYEQYAGTGLDQIQKDALISTLSGITGSGEFRVNTGKIPYFSFSGSLSGTSSTDRIDVLVLWHDGNMKFVFTPFGESTTTSELTYTQDDIIRYNLTQTKDAKVTTLVAFESVWQKDQKKIDLQFGSEKNKNHVSYNQTKENDFTLKIESPTVKENTTYIPLECQGKIELIKMVSCNILTSDEKKGSFKVELDKAGKFSGNVVTPSGNLDFDGYIQKDDFLINASAAGMSASLGNKRSPDGTYAGKLQLPVATVKWNGKIKNDILSDFHIGMTSPMAGVALDLVKKEDFVEGPFSVKIQGKEVSSGSIMIRSIPKYFDFRIDTIIPGIAGSSFIELHKFTDIKWDPSISLDEPTDAQSIFSGSYFSGISSKNDDSDFSDL